MVLSNKEWLNKMDEIISAIQNNGVNSQVIMDMLSNMWSSSITYNVGDYVLYNNKIWKCLVQNRNIIPTEGDTWTSVTITNEISTLNSNFSNNIEKCSKIIGFSQNKSLDQAVSEHINKLVPFGEGIIHGINITGTPLNETNDIIIKVININGNNWYRVVIYDCQSSSIHTITNIAGSWSNWITIS